RAARHHAERRGACRAPGRRLLRADPGDAGAPQGARARRAGGRGGACRAGARLRETVARTGYGRRMKHTVLLTDGAAADLAGIIDYVTATDGPLRAGRLLDQFEKTLARLEDLPDRGAHPAELLALGIRAYREVFFKPFRVIYRVKAPTVSVYVIAD